MKRRVAVLAVLLLVSACRMRAELSRDVIDTAIKRTVTVQLDERGSCTGVIVRRNLVLTAEHCIAQKMSVDGNAATPTYRSSKHDLALLRVPTADVPPLDIATAFNVGDPVFSVSNAGAYEALFDAGVIMKINGESSVVTSTLSVPGFSGSGLYDKDGRLVGLCNQYLPFREQGLAMSVYGQAVHAKIVAKFLSDAGVK